jgi:UDP-glucose 4-epimerase
MKLNGVNAVVTGGAGMLGSHLLENLLENDCNVTLIDNMRNGFMENISAYMDDKRVNFIEGDIRDLDLCLNALKDVDIVFHEAAQINPVTAVTTPDLDFDINVKGTFNMLEAARKNDVEKFLFASTNVYANPKYLPIDEEHPVDLLSPYAAAKLSGEAYCIVYNNTYDVKTVRLRYTNLYGPRQRLEKNDTGVIAIFVKRVLDGNPPIIFGDGNQTRDFVYITDVAKANMLAAESSKANGDVFNIGYGKETSMKDLAVKVIEASDSKDMKPIFGPDRAADFKRALIDISKAKEAFGYAPSVELYEGLRKTIDWWRKLYY